MNNKKIKEEMRAKLNDDQYLTSVAKQAFAAADKNHNNLISLKELKACMNELAQGLGCVEPTDKDVQEMFTHLDSNKDKKIDFNEFKSFVKENMLKLINRIPDN